ncbi:hypothetical protein E1267_01175 [Nonomuraea longispora]|uniref:Metalloprotease n=1 Tax=Nonomuraea longispora TaxID=1848320 RepID=A0A4R4NP63_9ACTN|nr:neutral zinc metallopeptidase [Nonomuraea longispora]TDC11308.1 hypothetical protein E1267_01175 [Nonomuraea longispora]
MRLSHLAAAVCVVAGLLLPGPARAAQREAPAGLPGEMSGTGLPLLCDIPDIRLGSVASLRSFHRAMADCADRFWAVTFAVAGLAYTPPELSVTTGTGSVCGAITDHGAQYCPDQQTIVVRIMQDELRDPFRMNIAHSVAHEWGHHVQRLTGVLDAYNALYQPASGQARNLLNHRLEMQAECYAGVFYSAALDSIGPGIAWEAWLRAVSEADESQAHGRPGNLAAWQDRGYRGGATGHCDTWTAGDSAVA